MAQRTVATTKTAVRTEALFGFSTAIPPFLFAVSRVAFIIFTHLAVHRYTSKIYSIAQNAISFKRFFFMHRKFKKIVGFCPQQKRKMAADLYSSRFEKIYRCFFLCAK